MTAVSFRSDIAIKWELSQILPYRSAKRQLEAEIRLYCPKRPQPALTVADGLREIIKELI
jgi:hypothetical protein